MSADLFEPLFGLGRGHPRTQALDLEDTRRREVLRAFIDGAGLAGAGFRSLPFAAGRVVLLGDDGEGFERQLAIRTEHRPGCVELALARSAPRELETLSAGREGITLEWTQNP